ncbi:hypothetical protein ACIRBX_10905 [Kitasatospora sp. NPDC096147]|uniref:hypothetical protein n=1 Tax=Kitasatospora sp. NPDC096147 TaxID=3364093 RepID=UPI003819A0AB
MTGSAPVLSRRAALLLAAGGLVQLSPPQVRDRIPAFAGPTAAATVPAVRPELEALLAERARALLRRDATALPTGEAGQALLRRTADLPLAELSYRVAEFSEPAGDTVTLTAELGWRVAEYDEYPSVLRRRLSFRRVGGQWGLTEEQADGPAAPWDLGPVSVVRGRHCLVLGQAAPAELARTVAAADLAVPLVGEVWGAGWTGRLLIEHPATEAQFDRLLGTPPGQYAGMAAVTTAAAGAPVRTPADRILINPQAYAGLSELGRRVVTVHEATHVATRADTRPWTPLWLSEGVADHTGYRGTGRTPQQIAPALAAAAAAPGFAPALPADTDFAAGSPGIALAYELAWSACDLIARRFGERRLVAFYRAAGAAGPTTTREEWLDGLLRTAFGLGLDEFTRQWDDDLHRRFGH